MMRQIHVHFKVLLFSLTMSCLLDSFEITNITKTEWESEWFWWFNYILYLETIQTFLCKVQATWRTKQKQNKLRVPLLKNRQDARNVGISWPKRRLWILSFITTPWLAKLGYQTQYTYSAGVHYSVNNLMILTFDETKATCTQATAISRRCSRSSLVHTAPLGLTQTY